MKKLVSMLLIASLVTTPAFARKNIVMEDRDDIPVRTISVYPIHHDKTIIVDNAHVETGSFNFSSAAAHKNSENVIVLWGNPKLATIYLNHWKRNWDQGQDYR